MNIRVRLTPDETRSRIVAVAEEHFRRVGYAKTAVADIAETLGMSPANIYRFFPSKGAINNAICERVCAESEVQVEAILNGPGSAAERLRLMILSIHRRHSALLTGEKRMYDMVEVAMEENWQAIDCHVRNFQSMLARVFEDGVKSGEFDPALPPAAMGKAIFGCCAPLFHPTLIAQCERKTDKPDPELMVQFILRALRPAR